MRAVVCVRLGLDGELGPFDACAYEAALEQGLDVTLLSMCKESDRDALLKLTRLGATRAVVLSDPAFAGADTLATAYALSLAVRKLSPDVVFCGRQTMIGDTAQTGIMLATLAGLAPITEVMKIEELGDTVTCMTRRSGRVTRQLPALLTVERINTLRLPRLRSRLGELEVWRASDIGADPARCGLVGSPTRVVRTFENESGKRRCKFIKREELEDVIKAALAKTKISEKTDKCSKKLDTSPVFSVGTAPLDFAKSIHAEPTVIAPYDTETVISMIKAHDPAAIIFGSDAESKRISAEVAARLSLGLCADLTAIEYDGSEIYMYRPALSGTVIAKIRSTTRPTLATVRTQSATDSDVTVAMGWGVKDSVDRVYALAESLGATVATTRKMTDNAVAPYDLQVGLTGRTVAPPVYIAIGISGAVHHIVGMERSGTVIAINPDKNAPIFDYADYGILEEF